MLDVKKLLSKILNSPFVIENGNAGGWYYRKWSNGVMEAWKYNWTSTGAFTSWGSLYYRDVAGPGFLSNWFQSTPIVTVTPSGSQAGVFGVYGTSATTVGTIRFIHNNTSSASAICNIYVYGFWGGPIT